MQWSGPSALVTRLKANKLLVVGGLFLTALPIGYAANNGNTATRLIAAALADPLSILGRRSPGERQQGALAQSKPHKQTPAAAPKPRERVLANVRSRPVIPGVLPKTSAQVPSSTGPGILDATPAASDALGSTTPFTPVGSLGGAGGGLPSGFVPTGITGGTPGTGPTADLPAPVTQVPEPQTWLMMVTGFLVMAFALRSRSQARRRKNEPQPEA